MMKERHTNDFQTSLDSYHEEEDDDLSQILYLVTASSGAE